MRTFGISRSRSVRRSAGEMRRRRILVAVISLVAIAISPIVAPFEAVAGLLLVVVGLALGGRDATLALIGVAVLAGPAAYTTVWLLTLAL